MKAFAICAFFSFLLLSPLASAQTTPDLTPLLCAIQTAVPAPAQPAAGTPEPLPKQFGNCAALHQCPSGCHILCNGNTNCNVWAQQHAVGCDNVEVLCPGYGCDPPAGCTNPCGYCGCVGHGDPLCAFNYCY